MQKSLNIDGSDHKENTITSERKQEATNNNWSELCLLEENIKPRYLTVKILDEGKNFNNISPFVIFRWISKIGKDIPIKKCKKDGTLTVTCVSESSSKKLLSLTNFESYRINVTPHKTLNTTKGVFRCSEIESLPNDEILSELRDQQVIHLRRIVPKKGRTIFVATFMSAELPERIRLAYMSIPINPYIPQPLRCYKCHRMNHTTRSCKSRIDVCGKCAKEKHEGDCDSIKCCNCGEEHFAWDRKCEVYKTQASIVRTMTLQRIPYNEAKKQIEIKSDKSYAKKTEAVSEHNIFTRLNEIITKIENFVHAPKKSNAETSSASNGESIKTTPPKVNLEKLEIILDGINNRLMKLENIFTSDRTTTKPNVEIFIPTKEELSNGGESSKKSTLTRSVGRKENKTKKKN